MGLFSMFTKSKKQDDIPSLLGLLAEDLEKKNLSTNRRDQVLGQLKVHSRDAGGPADALFSHNGIKILSSYSFGDFADSSSREASRCMANVLLLAPDMRQQFVDLGLATEAAKKLQTLDDQEEFLMSRILFVLTYGTSANFEDLVKDHGLAQSIMTHLDRHSLRMSSRPRTKAVEGMEMMALAESLKLVFNLVSSLQNRGYTFTASTESIFTILDHSPIPTPAMQPPMNYIINALASVEFQNDSPDASLTTAKSFEFTNQEVLTKLVTILETTLSSYPRSELEVNVIPLLTVLRKIYEASTIEIKKEMQRRLLPQDQVRDQPIGQSEDLASQLLRITTSTGQIELSESISGLMFELSDKDADRFVKNIGYGYAAGYLVSHNIPVPESARNTGQVQADGVDEKSAVNEESVLINPITGQRMDKEPVDTGPPMTEEEKEREAERLFVLFERLRATGVVKVENPVTRAMQEGKLNSKIEELDESD